MLSKVDLSSIRKEITTTNKEKRDTRYSKWHAESLTLEQRIGKGTYSEVFSALNKNKEDCAVKIIPNLEAGECFDYKKRLTLAASFCTNIASPKINVVEIIHIEDKSSWKGNIKVYHILIMQEKCACSLADLHHLKIKKGSPWTEEHLIRLVLAMSLPLDRCQESKLWHMDLHEGNILLSSDGSKFLLGDFGAPKLLKKRPDNTPYKTEYLPPEAPEIKNNKFNFDPFKADVYSLGIIILKLMTLKKEFPVSERSQIPKILKEYQKDYPFITKLLGEQMLVNNPNKRESFKEIRYYIMTYHFEIDQAPLNLVSTQNDQGNLPTPSSDPRDAINEKFALGEAYEHMNNTHMAEKSFQEVLVLSDRDDTFTKESAELYAVCLEKIAMIQIRKTNFNSALHTLAKLENYMKLDRVKWILGEDHRLFSTLYQYYGFIYFQLEDLDKSYDYLYKGYLFDSKIHGENHVNAAICKHHLGIIQFFKNQYPAALENMLSIAEMFHEMSGIDNEDCLLSLMMLGNLYSKLGQLEKALKLFEKVKDIAKEYLGETSDEYIQSVTDIARIYKKLGDHKGAFHLQVALLEKIRESKNKERFAEGLVELSDTFSKQEKHKEAVYTAELAFTVFSKIFYLKHEKSINAYNFLMKIAEIAQDEDVLDKYGKLRIVMKHKDETSSESSTSNS